MKILILEDDSGRVEQFKQPFIDIGVPTFVKTFERFIKVNETCS